MIQLPQSTIRSRFAAMPLVLAAVCLTAFPNGVFAQDSASFRGLLRSQMKETFERVGAYAEENGAAADVTDAYIWLFENAVPLRMEAAALPHCDRYLATPDANPAVAALARQVRGLGLARTGKMGEALEILDAELRSARFRGSRAALSYGLMLANYAQLAGELEATRTIYERIPAAAPLDPSLRDLASRKLDRLELVGKPAPSIHASDIKGERVQLSDYEGKVLLLDFWATNCAPCLEEFPNLKKLYAELHPEGFEIIGISLDPGPQIVEDFAAEAKLPWRMVMNEADAGDIGDKYAVPTIPALFLLDHTGKVRYFDIKGEDLREAVEGLLKARPKP